MSFGLLGNGWTPPIPSAVPRFLTPAPWLAHVECLPVPLLSPPHTSHGARELGTAHALRASQDEDASLRPCVSLRCPRGGRRGLRGAFVGPERRGRLQRRRPCAHGCGRRGHDGGRGFGVFSQPTPWPPIAWRRRNMRHFVPRTDLPHPDRE